jgi:hypothetical protein
MSWIWSKLGSNVCHLKVGENICFTLNEFLNSSVFGLQVSSEEADKEVGCSFLYCG